MKSFLFFLLSSSRCIRTVCPVAAGQEIFVTYDYEAGTVLNRRLDSIRSAEVVGRIDKTIDLAASSKNEKQITEQKSGITS